MLTIFLLLLFYLVLLPLGLFLLSGWSINGPWIEKGMWHRTPSIFRTSAYISVRWLNLYLSIYF